MSISNSQNHLISDDAYNNKNSVLGGYFFPSNTCQEFFLHNNHKTFFHLKAADEFSLAKKMQEWQPWEPLQNPPPADQWNWP